VVDEGRPVGIHEKIRIGAFGGRYEGHVVLVDLAGTVPGLLTGVTGDADVETLYIRLDCFQEVSAELAALLEGPFVAIRECLVLDNAVFTVRGSDEGKGAAFVQEALECL